MFRFENEKSNEAREDGRHDDNVKPEDQKSSEEIIMEDDDNISYDDNDDEKTVDNDNEKTIDNDVESLIDKSSIDTDSHEKEPILLQDKTKRLYEESIIFEDELLDDMIADDEIVNDVDDTDNDKDNDGHDMDNDNDENVDTKISSDMIDHGLAEQTKSTSKDDFSSSELLSQEENIDQDDYFDAVDTGYM